MKKLFLLIISLISLNVISLAQESVEPMINGEVVRKVSVLDIEGKEYYNVEVTLKSVSPDNIINFDNRVNVTVVNDKGYTVWRRAIKDAYLYVFSNGQVQVGKGKLDQIIISKSPHSDLYIGKIREKEGIE